MKKSKSIIIENNKNNQDLLKLIKVVEKKESIKFVLFIKFEVKKTSIFNLLFNTLIYVFNVCNFVYLKIKDRIKIKL